MIRRLPYYDTTMTADKWEFFTIVETGSNWAGSRWRWRVRRRDGSSLSAPAAFATLLECAEDAKRHGFTGAVDGSKLVHNRLLAEVPVAEHDESA